jgi:arabinoxylan arabinofuranohydrolase
MNVRVAAGLVRKGAARVAIFSGLIATSAPAFADYPIASHRYLADPGSLVLDGRVYLYNSNDDDNAEAGGYSMHSIVCLSSSDMKNWTDHGIVFQVPQNASWAQNSWAPQPVARDGTVYLYFGNSGSGVGVAKSSSPIGGFVDARGSVLVDGSTPGASGPDSWLFDPGILIDDDGQAYLAFGGNGESNARIIRLGSDLTSVSGTAAPFSPRGFYEAAFLFKRNDLYYLAYSTNPANGLRIDYLTSSSPMSGYTYRGVIGDQPPTNGDNNHASQFEFNGQWYHAYHNRKVATDTGTPKTYKRNIALEVMNFNADGTIQQVTYTTDGVPQVGHLDPYARVEAETTNAQSGIETEPCADGGMNVTAIDDGDWIRVRGVDFDFSGADEFSARVASNTNGGSIELRLDEEDGPLIATCTVPNTGGPQAFETTTCAVSGATGVKDLYLKFAGSDFNVDSWQFTRDGGGMGGTGGAGAGESGGAGVGPVAGGMPNGGSTTAGGAGLPNVGGAGAPSGGAGSGGSASLGGAPSAGGRPAGGGAPSSGSGGAAAGGRSGAAGMPAGGGVPSAEAGRSGAAPGGVGPEPVDDGCGCRMAGVPSRPWPWAFLTLAALVRARRWRRRTAGR